MIRPIVIIISAMYGSFFRDKLMDEIEKPKSKVSDRSLKICDQEFHYKHTKNSRKLWEKKE
ncbi:hypothetical protein ES705_45414 [subsurface metagenome]